MRHLFLRLCALLIVALLLLSCGIEACAVTDSVKSGHPALNLGVIDPRLLPIGYSGSEKFVYDISWSGGIKIGELHLDINALPEVDDGFEIRAFVTTQGSAMDLIYPVADLHVTKVRGLKKLPYHYEVWQKEGYKYQAHRVIEYDQEKGYIRYMKNNKLEGEYLIDGETNNEFSSFFNSRLMTLNIGSQFVVPTFADKKRIEVLVQIITEKELDETIIGPVSTVEIMPIMTFRGLYDKTGDTVIWYTNDECRVPVLINSKIMIGSLTAKLTAYSNPACKLYPSQSKSKQ